MVRAQAQRPGRRLSGRDPSLRLLDPVVDGVADDVRQRVLDRLEERAVELGLAPLHDQADLLAAVGTEVTDDTRQLRPQVVDLLHARLHHALLQLARDEVEPLRGPREVEIVERRGVLHDLVAGEHELAHQRHQRVEQVDIDADAAVGDAAARLGVAGLRRRLVVLRCGSSSGDGDGHGQLGDSVLQVVVGLVGLVCRRLARWGLDGRGGALLLGHGRGRSGRRRATLEDSGQPVHDGVDVDLVALLALRLDGGEKRADGVDHGQQHVGDLGRGLHLAVAQPAEKVLADVGHGLEAVERQETAGSLDRVNRAEDARQQLPRLRLLLESHEVAVELVQVLVALHEELLDDLVHPVHHCSSSIRPYPADAHVFSGIGVCRESLRWFARPAGDGRAQRSRCRGRRRGRPSPYGAKGRRACRRA